MGSLFCKARKARQKRETEIKNFEFLDGKYLSPRNYKNSPLPRFYNNKKSLPIDIPTKLSNRRCAIFVKKNIVIV